MRTGLMLLLTATAISSCGEQGADRPSMEDRGITERDLGSLEEIPSDRIYTISGEPTPLPPPVNTPASEYNPELSADGRRLYFSSRRPGGYGSNDIYVATRADRDAPFTKVENVGPAVNTEHWETGPTLTDDELELYYTSKRDGSRDLYVARRNSVDEPFERVEKLPYPINSGGTDSGPYVSGDGLDLLFSSIREGNLGHRDLFHARRSSRSDAWGEPQWLGPVVNTVSSDSSPAMSADKLTLFFHSRRRGGTTNHDILVTQRASRDSPWQEPKYLSFNTSAYHEGTPSLTTDGREFYMRSNTRPGKGEGNQDIWVVKNPFGTASVLPPLESAVDGRNQDAGEAVGDAESTVDG